MTPDDEKPVAPRISTRGKKRADEKFERKAAALRANLRRRHQQRRGQEDEVSDAEGQNAVEPDAE